jgi:hypothetical protein
MFKAIYAAVIGGNPMSLVALGLGVVVAAGALFGAGYYEGTQGCVTAQAKVTVGAEGRATAAQAKQDAKDYQAGKIDTAARAAANTTADDAVAKLHADLPLLVPHARPSVDCPKPPIVPAASMQRLNDPALVGETK